MAGQSAGPRTVISCAASLASSVAGPGSATFCAAPVGLGSKISYVQEKARSFPSVLKPSFGF